MKKMVLAVMLLAGSIAQAKGGSDIGSGTIPSGGSVGFYSNGRAECNLEVSITDSLGTGRDMFVAGVSQNKINPWGANFSLEMSQVDEYGVCPRTLAIDDGMGPGFGGTKMITLKFDNISCEITEYRVKDNSGQSVYCPNMKKIK